MFRTGVDPHGKRASREPHRIDEDTAIVVEGSEFRVPGSGAVSVVDGETVTYSNIAEEKDDRTLSLYNVRLHVLSLDDVFDLANRRPHLDDIPPASEEAAKG